MPQKRTANMVDTPMVLCGNAWKPLKSWAVYFQQNKEKILSNVFHLLYYVSKGERGTLPALRNESERASLSHSCYSVISDRFKPALNGQMEKYGKVPFIADVNIFRSEKELGKKVALIKGDITKLKVDAVVNAANRPLRGGGGVDGAIHKAAGTQQLLSETKKLYPQGCLPGNAVITKGFNLPAKSKFSIACNSPKSNHAPP
ncbi:protein-ADP-ribose hydrolase-like [Artemia franciscana]|uniref:protein-ADP-ribose hydrolase-like n=1 Tax=Artemia franciscana TaxID=6661 RepID=UPI0032DB8C4E